MSEDTLTGAAAAAPATTTTEATPPASGDTGAAEVKTEATPETKPVTGAPEKYEDFKLPEGFEMDQAQVESFLPIAKELNLTQEQAQKLVDLQTAHAKSAAEANQKAWESTLTEWADAARADKEFGGASFKDSLAQANKAIDAFGSKELRSALDVTGLGNHPEFLRFAYKVGKAISEDKFHVQNASSPAKPKGAAEHLFPNMNP